jgi:hypothetical protein
MQDKLQSQLTQAMAERATLYDAMKTSDQKVASLRNALAGIELEKKAQAKREEIAARPDEDSPPQE